MATRDQASRDPLWTQMRELADAHELPADHELRQRAQEFEEATAGLYGEPQTVSAKAFLGAWARARRAWADYTGESLI